MQQKLTAPRLGSEATVMKSINFERRQYTTNKKKNHIVREAQEVSNNEGFRCGCCNNKYRYNLDGGTSISVHEVGTKKKTFAPLSFSYLSFSLYFYYYFLV